LALALACAGAAPPTLAQTAYPVKAVRILVGAPAGGGTDIIARALADKLAAPLGQPVLVENRPGASNTIAADLTAKAPPDGHTLLAATNTGQAIAPHLLKLGFDPIKDLTPIALIVVVPNVLAINPNLPVKDVRELVALVKSRPGEFKYASSGVGSTQHLAGEGFSFLTGVKMVHVPYKGSSQAHLDLIGGEVQMMFDTTSSAIGHIRSGKLRALAVTSGARSAELPNVPTLAEAGFPGFEMTTWYGLYVTAGTPREVVARLQSEVARIITMPDVQARLKGLGGEPGNISPAQFAELNRAEYERFGKLIRDANIKIDGQ
jgi:tripartite-type tricarboxylate transporter receptor subunit TctC